MNYNTTGSSNAASLGKGLNLAITISPDSITTPIFLKGLFTIHSLSKIAEGKKRQEQPKCSLFGKKVDVETGSAVHVTNLVHICDFAYNPDDPDNRWCDLKTKFETQYSYLILEIKGGICTIKNAITHIRISFTDTKISATEEQSIAFAVYKETVETKVSLNANPTVLQGKNKYVELSWQIIPGEDYTEDYAYTLKEGRKTLESGKGKGTTNGGRKTGPVSIGDNLYTLELEYGGPGAKDTKVVRALKESEEACLNDLISNFCVSNNSNYLFSLILKKEVNAYLLDYIGYTNEGFLGQWSRFTLTAEDKEKLKPFATSPMIHLKDVGEVHGRLLFIGGSYVKPMEYSNKVAIVYLDRDLTVEIKGPCEWPSRMGHCCVTFPHGHDGEEKIWLLGGCDDSGNALNDIWVSGDGKKWDNINADWSVNPTEDDAKKQWEPRCMAGASVQLNDDGTKKALWIGGGFSGIGGMETADIWKLEKGLGKWEQVRVDDNNPLIIMPLPVDKPEKKEGSYLSSGLAFVGKDTNESTGMFVLGGYKADQDTKRHFKKIAKSVQGGFGFIELATRSADPFAASKNSYILTGYFKGCLWYMVFSNKGDVGISYSNLFYWVPEVTVHTRILS
jgi:hypothetical protein